MKLKVTKFEPITGKTIKGRFSFEFLVVEQLENGKTRNLHAEVNDCTFWENGTKAWVVLPCKRTKNEMTGNWEHAFGYFGFLNPKDDVYNEITNCVKSYVLKNNPELIAKNVEEKLVEEFPF